MLGKFGDYLLLNGRIYLLINTIPRNMNEQLYITAILMMLSQIGAVLFK
jgi:hypothetical protein